MRRHLPRPPLISFPPLQPPPPICTSVKDNNRRLSGLCLKTVSYAGDAHFPKHSLEYSLNFWIQSKQKKFSGLCLKRGRGAVGGSGIQTFVYQNWPDQIFCVVNFVFSHNGHFG